MRPEKEGKMEKARRKGKKRTRGPFPAGGLRARGGAEREGTTVQRYKAGNIFWITSANA